MNASLPKNYFDAFAGMQTFGHSGFDKDGRPIVWSRCSTFDPSKVNVESSSQFMIYFLDYVSTLCPPNTDQIIMIFDLKDTGYANF